MERASSYCGTIRECSTSGIAENGVRIVGNCASYLDITVRITLIALETPLPRPPPLLAPRAVFAESTLKSKSTERLEATVRRGSLPVPDSSTILPDHVS